jgi:hypothetical protein
MLPRQVDMLARQVDMLPRQVDMLARQACWPAQVDMLRWHFSTGSYMALRANHAYDLSILLRPLVFGNNGYQCWLSTPHCKLLSPVQCKPGIRHAICVFWNHMPMHQRRHSTLTPQAYTNTIQGADRPQQPATPIDNATLPTIPAPFQFKLQQYWLQQPICSRSSTGCIR